MSVAKTGVPDGCVTSYLKDTSEPQWGGGRAERPCICLGSREASPSQVPQEPNMKLPLRPKLQDKITTERLGFVSLLSVQFPGGGSQLRTASPVVNGPAKPRNARPSALRPRWSSGDPWAAAAETSAAAWGESSRGNPGIWRAGRDEDGTASLAPGGRPTGLHTPVRPAAWPSGHPPRQAQRKWASTAPSGWPWICCLGAEPRGRWVQAGAL